MAVMFGMFVPQGWRMDLVEIEDPVEQFEAMVSVAKLADEGPWDSIWLYDHFHTTPFPTMETTFEAWTSTAALVRETSRVNVGQMVTCNGYRNPALFAKMASTVDVASHGRLYAGYGAGWYEHEWRAYGYGFPETRERMRMFREGVEIIHKMWTEEKPTFEGKYYTINEPINEPKGVRKPHPAFWIGGGGEQVTLKLVAQFADACNINGDPETMRHKLDVLKGHCETVGRDYDEIIKSCSTNIFLVGPNDDREKATEMARKPMGVSYEEYTKSPWEQTVVGTSEEVAEILRAKVAAGMGYLIIYMPRIAYDHAMVEQFVEEVMPALA